jgi:hypothetical protein
LAAIVATRPFSVHKRVAWTGGFRNPGAPRSSVDAATGARASRRRLGRRRRRRSFARRGGPAEGARGSASVPPGAWLPDLRDACSQRRRSAAADGVMCRLRRPSRAEGVHGGAVPVVEHGSHGPPKRPLGSAPRDPCPPVERRLLRTNVLRVPDEGRLGMRATCCQRSPSASGALF